jgi:8-oxo-dGTP pyrophosphatase MutT (NUDIX family)
MFNIDLSTIKRCKNGEVITRIAAKAIVFFDEKLLMIKSIDGDLKFPGGGAKSDESATQALKREVIEETGFIIKDIISKLGTVNEFKADKYEKDAFFEMISHYFLCTLSEETAKTNMDEYEKKLQMKPVWISLDEAIKQNNDVIKSKKSNFWVERELIVLNELKNLRK